MNKTVRRKRAECDTITCRNKFLLTFFLEAAFLLIDGSKLHYGINLRELLNSNLITKVLVIVERVLSKSVSLRSGIRKFMKIGGYECLI